MIVNIALQRLNFQIKSKSNFKQVGIREDFKGHKIECGQIGKEGKMNRATKGGM